jgi:hypothetical protein
MPITSLLLPAFSGLTGSLAFGVAGWLGFETVRNNLSRRSEVPNTLADLVKWAAIVAPGVVLNKNGGFQTTFRYRGPDLDSSTESELVSMCARLNNIVRRLGSGWAFISTPSGARRRLRRSRSPVRQCADRRG